MAQAFSDLSDLSRPSLDAQGLRPGNPKGRGDELICGVEYVTRFSKGDIDERPLGSFEVEAREVAGVFDINPGPEGRCGC